MTNYQVIVMTGYQGGGLGYMVREVTASRAGEGGGRWVGELKFLFYFDRTLAIAFVIKVIILMPYNIKFLIYPIRRNTLPLFEYPVTQSLRLK